MKRWLLLVLLLVLLWGAFVRGAAAADRIILRNLDVIGDRSVKSFDLDGVVLDNGSVLGWDEIEKATLSQQQTEFDALLKEVGSDLYRIRQRLNVGDYAGLAPHAEALWPRYQGRRSKTAYLVDQAVMWSRLSSGQREEAVEAYLQCVECLRKDAALIKSIPGERRLQWDSETALCNELVPIWFRPDAAREVLPRVGAMIGKMQQPWPPGVRIYYATLATTAGDFQRASTALAELPDKKPLAHWPLIIRLQREIQEGKAGDVTAQVAAECQEYSGTARIGAHYWLGRAYSTDTDADRRRRGLLHLLRLPALYGDQNPEIAAAGLYYAMQSLTKANDALAAVSVRNELLERYGSTSFAELIRAAAEEK